MSSRSLSGGSPRRLWLDHGKWVLEVLRHVNIGHDLVRPTVERLSGQRQISSYFKSNPDQELLARGALKLMQISSADGSFSYSAMGSEWVSSSIPPGSPDLPDGNDTGPSLETQLVELQLRVTALMALHEGLLVRLARVEARVQEGAVPESTGGQRQKSAPSAGAARAERARAEPVAAPSEPPEAALDLDADADSGEADEADAVSEPKAEAEAAASLAPALAEAPPAAPAPVEPVAPRARARAALELAPLSELGKCIALLVGNGMSVEAGPELPVNAELRDCYAAAIEDDSGEQLGLVLLDLRATVFLGGSLMMQPSEQLEQQFAAAAPEQDSIAASAEICNALSGALNAAQSRYHVRAGELKKFDFARHPWLSEAPARRDLADSFGGRLAVFAIPGSS